MSFSSRPASLVNPSSFFREFVIPNYREFIADQFCPRRAYNAAVSIAHMADHIVIRGGGSIGQVKNKRNLFRKRNESFWQVQAMCNAFKHVHATGGGSRNSIVMTSTDMRAVDAETILFVSPINGEDREFRLRDRLLVCDFNDNGRERKIWVGWTLHCAIRFVAREVDCEDLLSGSDQPNQVELVYRPTTAVRWS